MTEIRKKEKTQEKKKYTNTHCPNCFSKNTRKQPYKHYDPGYEYECLTCNRTYDRW